MLHVWCMTHGCCYSIWLSRANNICLAHDYSKETEIIWKYKKWGKLKNEKTDNNSNTRAFTPPPPPPPPGLISRFIAWKTLHHAIYRITASQLQRCLVDLICDPLPLTACLCLHVGQLPLDRGLSPWLVRSNNFFAPRLTYTLVLVIMHPSMPWSPWTIRVGGVEEWGRKGDGVFTSTSQEIDGWMRSNRLKMNTDKTQLIWIGTR